MANEANAPTPVFKNVFRNLEGVKIFGANASNDPVLMLFSFRDGNPRLAVLDISDNKDERKPPITMAFDHVGFVSVVQLLKDAASNDKPCRYQVTTRKPIWRDNKPTDELETTGDLYVGKDKNGCVYLAVKGPHTEAELSIFKLRPSKYIIVRDSEQNELGEDQYSTFYAKGVASVLDKVMSGVVLELSKESENTVPINMGSTRDSRQPGNQEPKSEFEDLPY